MKIDLNEIEALARAATPGPWKWDGRTVGADDGYVHIPECSYIVGLISLAGHYEGYQEDCDFIAAANPAAVLELIALARQAAAPMIPAQTGIPVTSEAIEEIKDILLWPVTEDDARAAREMLQSIHFDLSMADTVAIPLVSGEELLARTQPLPKWIDDMKGSGPTTDSLIEYIEQLRGDVQVQVQHPVPGAAVVVKDFDIEDAQVLLSAAENMRSADKTGPVVDARFRIAYKVEQIAKRMFAQPPAAAQPVQQPAPVSDAALEKIIDHIANTWPMKKYTLEEIEDKLREFAAMTPKTLGPVSAWNDAALGDAGEAIRTAVNAAAGPGFHIRLSEMDFAGMIRVALAAHPANVAQVGVLNLDLIERTVERLNRAQIFPLASEWSAILAAAKKGGE